MDLRIDLIQVGELKVNCYLAYDETSKEAFLVDPGDDAARIIQEIENVRNLNLRYILLTHGHFDHVMALDDLSIKYPNATTVLDGNDTILYKSLPEQGELVGKVYHNLRTRTLSISHGATLPFCDTEIKAIATPGHTRGSVCFLINNYMFSGDTLFYHTYGRIDLPYSAPSEMKESLLRLFAFPEGVIVLPGHGRKTTIGEEKKFFSQL